MSGGPLQSGFSTVAGTGAYDLAQQRIIYVGNAGSDANTGFSINRPKQTPAAAFTAATALTPTAQFPVTVQAVDGFKYTGTVTVPDFVTFKCAVFEGKIILGIQSIAEIGVHYGVDTVTEMVEVPAAVVGSQYHCRLFNPGGYDDNVVGLVGIKMGNAAVASFSIQVLQNYTSTLIRQANGSEMSGRIENAKQWGDGSTIVQCTAADSVTTVFIGSINNGDVAATNTRIASIPGGNQNNEINITGGQISITELVEWTAGDNNALNLVSVRFDGVLDYAGGNLTTLYPGLIANTNTAGLVPAPDGTGTKQLTDTSPTSFL